jgi:subtilisin family serine protease
MKKTALYFYLLLSVILMMSYTNCSQFKMADTSRNIASSLLSTPLIAGSVESDYQTALANNVIPAFQDRMFRFRIPRTGNAATFTVTGLPAWLALDAVTGELSGVPTVMSTYNGITATVTEAGVPTVQGPYSVSVAGNPLKAQQWHLKNLGQKAYSGLSGIADQDIHLDQTIRDGFLGKNIRIAISDSGVYEAHRNLAPNIVGAASKNYFNDYAVTRSWLGNSSPATNSAGNAHGTAVAGLVGERGWSDLGGRGVAPLASLSGFLFIQAQTTLSARGYLTAGLYDNFDGNFDVFNFSWGDPQCYLAEYDDSFSQKLLSGVTNLRTGRGSVYVMASGNDFYGALKDCYANSTGNYLGNANSSELATTPFTILVGAINANGVSSSYSSPGSNLWISAPGGEYGLATTASSFQEYIMPALISTDFVGCSVGLKTFSAANSPFNAGGDPNTTCEHTSTMNGTSGATPQVTGAAALMLSANPNLNWRDVKHIMAVTADQVDASAGPTGHPIAGSSLLGHTYQQGWVTNAAGYKFHNWYGFGRVNVDRAVNMAKTYVSALGIYKSTGYKYDSGNINVAAPAGSAAGVTRTLAVTESWSVESVQVKFSERTCTGNIGLELTSPAGTKSILWNINSGILETSTTNHVLLSNAFYGENSAGTWSLKMISGAAACAPTLVSWQLNISGH